MIVGNLCAWRERFAGNFTNFFPFFWENFLSPVKYTVLQCADIYQCLTVRGCVDRLSSTALWFVCACTCDCVCPAARPAWCRWVLGIISGHLRSKGEHLLANCILHFPHWHPFFKGGIPFCCIWSFVTVLFISLFGRTAGVGRIRAHGEDLSSSARLSSAAADRVLFHSLQWKRVHRDLRESIVCAPQCLITWIGHHIKNLGSRRERGSSSKTSGRLPTKKKRLPRGVGWWGQRHSDRVKPRDRGDEDRGEERSSAEWKLTPKFLTMQYSFSLNYKNTLLDTKKQQQPTQSLVLQICSQCLIFPLAQGVRWRLIPKALHFPIPLPVSLPPPTLHFTAALITHSVYIFHRALWQR